MKNKVISSIIVMLIFIFNISMNCYAVNEPDIIAEAAILIDSSSEKILYSKNATEKMYPASTTKILTAILVIENCNLEDIVTVPYEAISSIPSGYSVAALQAGEQCTVNQLLQMMLVYSANDAANVLAYHVSSSLEAFSTLMNNKISELGLKNTHFVNPSGMHDKNHYTTAYDLAIIMKYCMKNSTFRSLETLKYCTIPATNKYEERVFNTTNELLRYDNRDVASNYYYKYAIAGKTGYTTPAKNCLVSVSNKDNLELICVVLSAGLYPDNLSARFIDTKSIFNYGYDNFTIRKLREKNAVATEIEINNATKETKYLNLQLTQDITALISKNDLDTEFTPEIEVEPNLLAPIAQNQIVGKIKYNIDGIEYSSDLIASHSVEPSSSLSLIIQIILVVFILYLLYKLLTNSNNNKKKKHKIKKRRK